MFWWVVRLKSFGVWLCLSVRLWILFLIMLMFLVMSFCWVCWFVILWRMLFVIYLSMVLWWCLLNRWGNIVYLWWKILDLVFLMICWIVFLIVFIGWLEVVWRVVDWVCLLFRRYWMCMVGRLVLVCCNVLMGWRWLWDCILVFCYMFGICYEGCFNCVGLFLSFCKDEWGVCCVLLLVEGMIIEIKFEGCVDGSVWMIFDCLVMYFFGWRWCCCCWFYGLFFVELWYWVLYGCGCCGGGVMFVLWGGGFDFVWFWFVCWGWVDDVVMLVFLDFCYCGDWWEGGIMLKDIFVLLVDLLMDDVVICFVIEIGRL